MKRIASIQDISCLGRCSLTVALPVISAMAVECAIVPTAVLSTHTMFPGFISRDLSDQLLPIARHWKSQNVTLDAICTGYLASPLQTEEVCRFFDLLAGPDTLLFVDPAMADGGRLYAGFGPDFPGYMRRVVARAHVAVPNVTEACLLTGTPYRETEDLSWWRDLLRRVAEAPEEAEAHKGWAKVRLVDGRVGYVRDVALEPVRYEMTAVFSQEEGLPFDEALAKQKGIPAAELVQEALEKCGRRDLIGYGPKCLLRPEGGRPGERSGQKTDFRKNSSGNRAGGRTERTETNVRKNAGAKKKTIRNVHKKK